MGFERVHVPAGITVTVNLYPAFTDFTHVDGSGNRSPMPGYHTISFGVASDSNQMGYAEHVVLAQLTRSAFDALALSVSMPLSCDCGEPRCLAGSPSHSVFKSGIPFLRTISERIRSSFTGASLKIVDV